MNRRDAIKTLGALAGAAATSQLLTGCVNPLALGSVASDIDANPPNFGLVNSNVQWRRDWTSIVAGKFASPSYSCLFFYEGSTGYGELWAINGSGGLLGTAPLATYTAAQLGGRIWTHVVPGYWGPSGYMGLLFFDQTTGNARFYDSSATGALSLLKAHSGWRTSWTHIVPGYFASPAVWNNVTVAETYTQLFFYSPSEQQAQVWTSDGTGAITLYKSLTYGSIGTWTHVVSGDFCVNSDNDQYSDILFYNSSTGSWALHYTRFATVGGGTQLLSGTPSAALPAGITAIVPGNFGGSGMCDVALFTASTGALSFRTLSGDSSPVLQELEVQTYPRSTATIVVPGNFVSDSVEEDWFFTGDYQTNEQLRSWHASAGGFASLLFYNPTIGIGDVYFHEPRRPPPDPLTGYVTSTTNHLGATVSTGSVLPGETIAVHVSSQIGRYTATIRNASDAANTELATIGGLPTSPTPLSFPRTAYKDGAGWPSVASFTVPAGWASGLYLVHVVATATGAALDIPFVVRAATAAANKALVVIADTTYEAYNDWGGRSFYGYSNVVDGEPASPTDFASRGAVWPQGGARAPYAFTVSFDRPQDGRYETHGHKWTYWEQPFVRWLVAQSIPFDVCTHRDIHFEAPSGGYKALVFTGHHEYWSLAMRSHVASFASSGGNVIFMSGNVCWWQVRISNDGSTMTCYKNAAFDPDKSSTATVNWYDAPVSNPETSLTGVSYNPGSHSVVYSDPLPPFVVVTGASGDALLRGTRLSDGDAFGTYGDGSQSVVGSETDRRQPSTPGTFKLLAAVTLGGAESGSMGYFSTNSFVSRTITTATINWTLGLSQSTTTWNEIDQISFNILTDCTLGPDLAFGSVAAASSSYEDPDWSLTHLTDGNRRTGYSSQVAENDSSKAVNHTEWVTITLPAVQTFSKIVLYPRNDAPYVGMGFPIDFQIQVWTGVEWLTRVTVTGATPIGSHRQVYTWGMSDRTNAIRVLATNLRQVLPMDGYLLQLAQISVHA